MPTQLHHLAIRPDQYSTTPVFDLLEAAARGRVGIDHRLLHAIVDRRDEAIPALVRFGLTDLEKYPVNLEEDLIAMLRYLRTPEALPFYAGLLRRYPGELPDDLLEAFHDLGAASVDPLLAAYEELGEEAGSEIPFALASLRVRDDRVLKVLLDHLEYDAADGALCLGLYGDPAAKEAIERLLAELAPDNPDLANLRQDLEHALENIDAPSEPETIPAFDLWAAYSEVAPPTFAALSEEERLAYLESPEADEREPAAAAFFNEDLSANARKRLFEAAQHDPDPRVRARCWEAMAGELDNAGIKKEMITRLSDPDAPAVEKAGLVVGLAFEAGEEPVRKHVIALYGNPETRAKAMEAMWRSLDRTFADFFPKHLDDPDPELKRQAIWGSGHLGIASVMSKLREFFSDEEFRADALFAYALAAPSQITPGAVRSLLAKIDRESEGLSSAEMELVETALDQRLIMHGRDPIFETEMVEEQATQPAPGVTANRPGRNDPCPCGSGKKYKKCCGS